MKLCMLRATQTVCRPTQYVQDYWTDDFMDPRALVNELQDDTVNTDVFLLS
jgi:hypothetical protein